MEPDPDSAKDKLAAVAKELGHEIHVFKNAATSSTSERTAISSKDEPDDFYDLTEADYYRLIADKIGGHAQILKTRKMREAEAAARRARITKAVIRVRFPDNYVLEAKFHSSERIQDLINLLKKVVAKPDLPFYLYTAPPKQRIKDMSKDFYTAGFAPGAIVYFSYDVSVGEFNDLGASAGAYLRDDICSLNGLDSVLQHLDPDTSGAESAEDVNSVVTVAPTVPEPKPDTKKPAKPKWLKL